MRRLCLRVKPLLMEARTLISWQALDTVRCLQADMTVRLTCHISAVYMVHADWHAVGIERCNRPAE